MKTAQEWFDIVVSHLSDQRKQSRRITKGRRWPDGACMYRSPKGLKCAVGACIPDNLYTPLIDSDKLSSTSISAIFIQYKNDSRLGGIINHLQIKDYDEQKTISFWSQLQIMHDEYSVRNWPKQLMIIAEDYNLIYNGPAVLEEKIDE